MEPFLAGITQNRDKLGQVTCRRVPAPIPKGAASTPTLVLISGRKVRYKSEKLSFTPKRFSGHQPAEIPVLRQQSSRIKEVLVGVLLFDLSFVVSLIRPTSSWIWKGEGFEGE